MKDWDMKLFSLLMVAGFVYMAITTFRDIRACEARGGVSIGSYCLRKDVVLP